MNPSNFRYGVIGLFAWLNLPGAAIGADHEAGVPLVPAEAAGPWTLVEAGQQPICIVTLTGSKSTAGFTASLGNCGAALPTEVSGWTPTGDGMAMTGADGKVLIAFNRWSYSLFVSHRSSGVDLQLRRGTD